MVLVLGAAACGGGDKKVESGASDVTEESDEEEYDEDEGMIPEEKFGEIKSTFERKATTVARCFPEAVTAGEVDQNDRIKMTVGLVIKTDGSPSELEVLGSSKRSKTLEDCVLKSVSRWEFTTLPQPLQYSYGFVLQRF